VKLWLVGLCVAVVAAVAIGVLVLVTAATSQTLVLDLDAGDCFDLDLDALEDGSSAVVETVDTIDCAEQHLAQVAAVGELDPDGDLPRPADFDAFAMADARCAVALADRAVLLERFGVLPVVADERSWESFEGRYVCVLIPYGGEPTTGSALD
jgi:hypothetical protein